MLRAIREAASEWEHARRWRTLRTCMESAIEIESLKRVISSLMLCHQQSELTARRCRPTGCRELRKHFSAYHQQKTQALYTACANACPSIGRERVERD